MGACCVQRRPGPASTVSVQLVPRLQDAWSGTRPKKNGILQSALKVKHLAFIDGVLYCEKAVMGRTKVDAGAVGQAVLPANCICISSLLYGKMRSWLVSTLSFLSVWICFCTWFIKNSVDLVTSRVKCSQTQL